MAGEDVKTATEAATEPAEAEKPMTKYGKFCQKKGINPNLIMLKITLFVMYGGKFSIIHNHKSSEKYSDLHFHPCHANTPYICKFYQFYQFYRKFIQLLLHKFPSQVSG